MQLSRSLNKQWKGLRNTSIILVILGAGLNLIAVATNNGKMPVLTNDGETFCYDSKHFCYTSYEQVNHWYLTDGIVFYDKLFASIGDILVTIGFCFLLYVLGLLIYHLIYHWNKQRLLSSNISTGKNK